MKHLVLCAMQNCDYEGHLVIIEYFFVYGKRRRPVCRAIWRVCEYHAIMLTRGDIVSRIQALH